MFIAAHWMAMFFSQYQSWVNICIVVSIVVANLADTIPTAGMLTTSLKSVRNTWPLPMLQISETTPHCSFNNVHDCFRERLSLLHGGTWGDGEYSSVCISKFHGIRIKLDISVEQRQCQGCVILAAV